MRNIVLIGLSGSGKSTLATRAAKELGLTPLDLDAVIEERAGMGIPEIFSRHGEEHFRDLETRAVLEAAKLRDRVIATGGGAVLREENVRALRDSGLVIFIDRPVERIVRDLEVEGRPLLRDGADKLYQMARQRRDRYETSCHVTFHNDGPLEQALPALLALIRGETLSDSGYSGYAVIGEPIGHSLSPLIHATVFAAKGVERPYLALQVRRGALGEFMNSARKNGLRGFNVTSPHKKDIIPLLDHVDHEAMLCGAVNTVVRRGERYFGYNTDMEGLYRSILAAGADYRGKRIMILGTGGAAAGVALKAAGEEAAHIAVHGRRPEAVGEILDLARGKTAVAAGDLGEGSLTASAATADLLINTLPLGMTGTVRDERRFEYLSALPAGALVVELVYSPPRTPLMMRAEELGHPTLGGLPMLIYQAILSDQHYLDEPLDLDDMYRRVAAAIAADAKQKEETAP